MDIAWRYIGTGTAHYYGVPARDLKTDEFAALTEGQQAAVEHGQPPLYERAAPARAMGTGRRVPVSGPAPAAPESEVR